VQATGLLAVGAFSFSLSFGILWVMKRVWGIRVHPSAETEGLDWHEHGMWGYAEVFMDVPGGLRSEEIHVVRTRLVDETVDEKMDEKVG
jgi:hypothetical protein